MRCGPGLPAVLALAFIAATRLDWRRLILAELLCADAVITQAWYDPARTELPARSGDMVSAYAARDNGGPATTSAAGQGLALAAAARSACG